MMANVKSVFYELTHELSSFTDLRFECGKMKTDSRKLEESWSLTLSNQASSFRIRIMEPIEWRNQILVAMCLKRKLRSLVIW